MDHEMSETGGSHVFDGVSLVPFLAPPTNDVRKADNLHCPVHSSVTWKQRHLFMTHVNVDVLMCIF